MGSTPNWSLTSSYIKESRQLFVIPDGRITRSWYIEKKGQSFFASMSFSVRNVLTSAVVKQVQDIQDCIVLREA